MRASSCASICAILLVLFVAPASLWAAGPMESVQATTERVVEILCDDALKGDSNRDKRKEMVSKTVKERFDWEAIARGALAAHWRDLDRTQQEEFTELFGALLERTYLEYLDEYSGEEEIVYVSEEMEGTRARVNGKFITRKKQEIPVEYRMRKRNGDWLISDVLVEGVSLVRNYRVQFNDIVSRSSYEDLVKRIKEKMEEDI